MQESSLIVEAQDIDPAGISSEENCQSERDNLSHIFQITYFNWRMDIGMIKNELHLLSGEWVSKSNKLSSNVKSPNRTPDNIPSKKVKRVKMNTET